MGRVLVPWVFTTRWASGVNACAIALVLGLLGRCAHVAALPDVLTVQ